LSPDVYHSSLVLPLRDVTQFCVRPFQPLALTQMSCPGLLFPSLRSDTAYSLHLHGVTCRDVKCSGGLVWLRSWTLLIPWQTVGICWPDGRQDALIWAQPSSVPPVCVCVCVCVMLYTVSVLWHYNSATATAVPKDVESSLETSDCWGSPSLDTVRDVHVKLDECEGTGKVGKPERKRPV
jgi:hypothetical protein